MAKLKAAIRNYKESDKNFIMSSWLRGFHGSFCTGPIRDNMYWHVYKLEIEDILENPDVSIRVACSSSDEDLIIGYSVEESGHVLPVIHWVFVKPMYRRKGVAKILCKGVKGKDFLYTFGVKDATEIVVSSKTFAGGIYNPNPVKKKGKYNPHHLMGRYE